MAYCNNTKPNNFLPNNFITYLPTAEVIAGHTTAVSVKFIP